MELQLLHISFHFDQLQLLLNLFNNVLKYLILARFSLQLGDVRLESTVQFLGVLELRAQIKHLIELLLVSFDDSLVFLRLHCLLLGLLELIRQPLHRVFVLSDDEYFFRL